MGEKSGDDFFKLEESLVGVNPLPVQSVLSEVIAEFINKFEVDAVTPFSIGKKKFDLKFHVLDRNMIKNITSNQ